MKSLLLFNVAATCFLHSFDAIAAPCSPSAIARFS
jgi:hypothetical protein